MCLDTVNPELEPCTEGYKVFELNRRTNRLSSQYFGRYGRCKYRRRWLNADDYYKYSNENRTIASNAGLVYPAGWHTYHSIYAAIHYMDMPSNQVVAKVLVREPLATGYQGLYNALITVSCYIKIEEVYV